MCKGFNHSVLGRKFVVTIPLEVLVCVGRFPVHCNEMFVVRSWYKNCVQKAYRFIYVMFLCSELYTNINGVEVFEENGPVSSVLCITKVSSTFILHNLGGLDTVLMALVQTLP